MHHHPSFFIPFRVAVATDVIPFIYYHNFTIELVHQSFCHYRTGESGTYD
jgi:hypothetical protein